MSVVPIEQQIEALRTVRARIVTTHIRAFETAKAVEAAIETLRRVQAAEAIEPPRRDAADTLNNPGF